MNEEIIFMATIDRLGKVEAQCRPMHEPSMEAYSLILAVMVRATINMFKEHGISEKEAVDTILKRLTREVRNPSATSTYSQTMPQ